MRLRWKYAVYAAFAEFPFVSSNSNSRNSKIMAYVGRGIDKLNNIENLDVITFTSSAGPYNLLKSTVAFTPSSANSLVISIDGVIQAPESYTISGSTVTFDSSISSASTNDFIYHMGVGITNTPVDGSVTAAKLATTGSASSSTLFKGRYGLVHGYRW